MTAYLDTVEDYGNGTGSIVSNVASATDTVEDDGNGIWSIVSTVFKSSIDLQNDAGATSSYLYVEDLQNDVNGAEVLVGERFGRSESITAQAKAEATTRKQTLALSSTFVVDAKGDDTAVRARRVVPVTLQNDVGAEGPIASQRLVTTVDLESDARGLAAVEAEILRAVSIVESDVFGIGAEANFFAESVEARGSVVRAVMRVKATFTEDASAQTALVSDALRQLYKDTLEEDAKGDSSVTAQQLAAVQEVVNSAEVVDELLNVLSDEAWVFNSWTLAFSRYVNFGVNDGADVEGTPLFTSPKGLHKLSSTNTADALVQFGLSNMGAMAPKRMRAVYVTTAGQGVVKLATFHGLQGRLQETNYVTPTRDSAVPINRRISPARGHQGQYWGFRIEVTSGRLALTRVHVLPLVTGRNL